MQGKIRIEGGYELRRFVARNLRPILPVAWDCELAYGLLDKFDNMEDGEVRPVPVPVVDVSPKESEQLDDGIVEYPDGAPPELVREMKEPDDSYLMPRSTKRTVERKPQTGMKMARQGPLIPRAPAQDVDSASATPEVFGKTHGCPACQSGMVAPGIRHSAACKRRKADFDLKKEERFR